MNIAVHTNDSAD